MSRLSLALSLAGLLVFAADGGASSGSKAVKIAAAGCSPYFTHVVFGDAQLLGP